MKIIRVTAGVITDNDKVLITRRAPKKISLVAGSFQAEKSKSMKPHKNVLLGSLKKSLI